MHKNLKKRCKVRVDAKMLQGLFLLLCVLFFKKGEKRCSINQFIIVIGQI